MADTQGLGRVAPLGNYVAVVRSGGQSHAFRDAKPLCRVGGEVLYLTTDPVVTCLRCQRRIAAEADPIRPTKEADRG